MSISTLEETITLEYDYVFLTFKLRWLGRLESAKWMFFDKIGIV